MAYRYMAPSFDKNKPIKEKLKFINVDEILAIVGIHHVNGIEKILLNNGYNKTVLSC